MILCRFRRAVKSSQVNGLFYLNRFFGNLPIPQTGSLAHYMQGAVELLLHDHLIGLHYILPTGDEARRSRRKAFIDYLIKPAVMSYGVVVSYCALGLYAKILVQIEVFRKSHMHIRVICRAYPEPPVKLWQILLEKLICADSLVFIPLSLISLISLS